VTSKLEDFLKAQDLGGSKLEHFGVRGMKWGIRRSDTSQGSSSSSSSSNKSGEGLTDAARAAHTMKVIMSSNKSGISKVSDADLAHLNHRLSLEKRFSELKPPSTSHPILKKVGKTYSITSKVLKAGGGTMNSAIKFGKSDAGQFLFSVTGHGPTGKHRK
jgi:hypothetical protein